MLSVWPSAVLVVWCALSAPTTQAISHVIGIRSFTVIRRGRDTLHGLPRPGEHQPRLPPPPPSLRLLPTAPASRCRGVFGGFQHPAVDLEAVPFAYCLDQEDELRAQPQQDGVSRSGRHTDVEVDRVLTDDFVVHPVDTSQSTPQSVSPYVRERERVCVCVREKQ